MSFGPELADLLLDAARFALGHGFGGCYSVPSPYRSGPSKFWLKTKNVVENDYILLGTDYDNEGKPIAYLGKKQAGELKFAGTAFLTLSGAARDKLQQRIETLVTERPPVRQRVCRQPQWLKPEPRVRVKHLHGGDTLRHATVKALSD